MGQVDGGISIIMMRIYLEKMGFIEHVIESIEVENIIRIIRYVGSPRDLFLFYNFSLCNSGPDRKYNISEVK